MIQQSYHHHGKRTRGAIGAVTLSVIALLAGGFFVLKGIAWFREEHYASTEELQEETSIGESERTNVVIDATANIRTVDGGEIIGAVYRRGTELGASYTAIVRLPLIESDAYEIWMIDQGFVNVRSVGVLEARADGSFAATFSLADPFLFPDVVIMREPNDGITTPSGNTVAKGSFE